MYSVSQCIRKPSHICTFLIFQSLSPFHIFLHFRYLQLLPTGSSRTAKSQLWDPTIAILPTQNSKFAILRSQNRKFAYFPGKTTGPQTPQVCLRKLPKLPLQTPQVANAKQQTWGRKLRKPKVTKMHPQFCVRKMRNFANAKSQISVF